MQSAYTVIKSTAHQLIKLAGLLTLSLSTHAALTQAKQYVCIRSALFAPIFIKRLPYSLTVEETYFKNT